MVAELPSDKTIIAMTVPIVFIIYISMACVFFHEPSGIWTEGSAPPGRGNAPVWCRVPGNNIVVMSTGHKNIRANQERGNLERKHP